VAGYTISFDLKFSFIALLRLPGINTDFVIFSDGNKMSKAETFDLMGSID